MTCRFPILDFDLSCSLAHVLIFIDSFSVESFPSPPGHLPTFDILSSMQLPFNTTDTEAFSLRIMIDSYRRAAKYLLDTANHLELVARRNSNKKSNKKENKNNHDKNNNNTKPSKNGKPPKEEPTF